MDHTPKGRSQSLRGLLHGKGKLEPFDDSQLANDIGLVCMIESADGMMVFQNRSSKVANRPLTISSSVSGALNKLDIAMRPQRNELSLKDITLGLFRETLGELNVEIRTLRFLGIIREFLRGGKPEFYFLATSNSSLENIRSAHAHAEEKMESKSVDGFEFHSKAVGSDDCSRFAFQQRVIDAIVKYDRVANFTFVAGLLLAASHVLRNAAETGLG